MIAIIQDFFIAGWPGFFHLYDTCHIHSGKNQLIDSSGNIGAASQPDLYPRRATGVSAVKIPALVSWNIVDDLFCA